MALYEITEAELAPFARASGGQGLYESEIEDLAWGNLDEFAGEALFPIARQPTIGSGGRPDIVALDADARVVVIEIKRDVERSQLAQCLEYAGWARHASLDELAQMYYAKDPDKFFSDWQQFTDSTAPVVINPQPRLVLIARDIHGRTESALEFLIENNLPVVVVRVSMYEDPNGRRFVDIEGDLDPATESPSQPHAAREHTKYAGRRMTVSDLVDNGVVEAGQEIVWVGPKTNEMFNARIERNGSIRLDDGRVFSSPSRAAREAAGIAAYDGWMAWVLEGTSTTLDDLRRLLSKKVDNN